MIISTPPVFRYKPVGALKPSLFLAGSIDMGRADDWQNELINQIGKHYSICFNPRRENFNPDWPQGIAEEQFNVQVTWEMSMIEKADVVAFYFQPGTNSPITLLELGLVAASKPSAAVVLCPDGFHRAGNVAMVCERYGIRTVDTMAHLIAALATPTVRR